jgi:hypothetical protein
MNALGSAALLSSLAGKIFLGEAYPSGNAYLQPLTLNMEVITFDKRPPLEAWPSSVALYCLKKQGCEDKEVGRIPRTAKRNSYFEPILSKVEDTKNNTVEISYDYIPAREGMNEGHNSSCGLKYKMDKRRRYADSGDFFVTISDFCFFDEAIAHYKIDKPTSSAAYQVVAVSSDLGLEAIRHGMDGEKRPLSKEEGDHERAQSVNLEDCTTKPGSRADAVVLWIARLKGSKQSLRISKYDDPGCAGHMSTIYLLDILEGDKAMVTAVAVRYFGVI